ncbi:MAG: NTP transferase domain-containing protein [Caldilineaceae bacterium]|nr:NTP transferase domain-containing protein [Caldilineaceae bacterium]
MKAVVMAGGDGARLRPLTIGRPKPMVPLANKPVMRHILELLQCHGITDVVVTLRYLANVIQDFFGDGSHFGMNISYVVEDMPLGTAGSVKHAADYLDDTFLVISGDALTDFDLRAIVQAHKERNVLATLALTRVPNPLEYGVVVTNEHEYVSRFLEKPGWAELISDTVNTGIYVLEPEALALIPSNVPYDFSHELFPKMLEKGIPIYGHTAEGYWCDVGNIPEYQRATADLLYGRVKLAEPIGDHIGGGIWVGKNVEIAPSAQLFGPIFLGDEVKIKGDVQVYGPSVIRDYTVIDNYSRIERSIIWRNNYIGENCEIRGATISRQCSIKPKAVIYEGTVIGDNCALGEGAVIHADVKLWPHKQIDAGATVKESIIWGEQGRRSLFSRFGVSGVVNVDLSPEYAAKLSAALGATLPKGCGVAINRDVHRSSRMLKRALVSGLPSTGIDVWDLGSVAIPVARYFVRTHEHIMAGIHVRLSPFDQRVVDIRIMNADGMNQSTNDERVIERNFFREDFRRAFLDEIGLIQYVPNPLEEYTRAFMKKVDTESIRNAQFKIVVDYSHGLTADTLSGILNRLGVDVLPLNALTDETKLAMLQSEFKENQARMSKIVRALDADLGVQFDVGGEKIFLVDEQGKVIEDVVAAALLTELALYANPGQQIAAMITLPNAFDTIAEWHGSQLTRIGNNMHQFMRRAHESGILMAIDGTGNYIFPDFHPTVDGMMATARLLEYLAKRKLPLSQVIDYLPPMHLANRSVHCPWDDKGLVMRRLNEQYKHSRVDNIDGLKVYFDDGEWVHFSPNPDKPQFEILAEAATDERVQELVVLHQEQIEQFLLESEAVVE